MSNQKSAGMNSKTDYKNIAYMVEGTSVQLTSGYSEMEATPGSSSKIITKYFGNEAMGDLDGDGMPDVAFLLTQEGGGSGTFYYVVAALKTADGYNGTNGILLGDRIAPQTTEISDKVVIVNYAIREPRFEMTAAPSVGVSKYFIIQNGVLTEKSMIPAFGMPQKMSLNVAIQFSDGLTVVIDKIDDSRCKPGVVCVWAGELSLHFAIAGGNVNTNDVELTLGTAQISEKDVSGYRFLLTDATETTATIIVTKTASAVGACYRGGCSGQVCSDRKDVVTTCEYKAEYGCYASATCERQTNGQCGWTQTPALIACLSHYQ